MSAFSRIEDPKVLTIIIAALISGILWIATWQSMSGMAMMDMGEMDMGGMQMGSDMSGDAPMAGSMADKGSMAAPMDGMSGDKMTAPMDGMSGEAMATPMQMEGMGQMDGMGMMTSGDWRASTIMATMSMWVLMMAAMMLPAMAPVMSVYASVSAKEDRGMRLALRITLFTLSYFTLWAVFSLAAALAQLALRDSAWFTMSGTLAVPLLAGVLMIVAGGYQFTALKDVCLRHCRHPLQYLLSHWKGGLGGAFPVGFRHGLYCFGCCIAFMGLMFVFGAMNVWAMAAIAVYFLAEKILPGAEIWGKITGGLLVAGGAAMIGLNI
ncbi:MAG: DUF2182 domain-containing protein [Pseudomonadota bacterium]